MTVDPSAFRHALGRFASGVCVITTRTPAGQALGVTISSFCSVSLDPPLVLFCLGKNTNNFAAYARHTDFAVNVLAENQIELSENFASKSEDKFDGVAFEEERADARSSRDARPRSNAGWSKPMRPATMSS